VRKPWRVEEVLPAPRRPDRRPVVLSPDEVLRFLDGVPGPKHRAILTTCYAAGLRISEALHLRPTDIDSRRMVIRVAAGKGQKDRYVMLSARLLDLLRTWWHTTHPTGWLFPGNRPGQALSAHAVEKVCHRRVPMEITVDVPAPMANQPSEELARRTRLLLVIDEVQAGRLTRPAAAQALQMTLDEFLIEAGRHGLYAIDYSVEDFRREVAAIGNDV
jgi:predicted HTH domain antitoxin